MKTLHLSISVIILVIVIATSIYFYNERISVPPASWITSGPFAINKSQYKLGENIFMVVSDLKPSDAGEFEVVDPKGGAFAKVQFNGTEKSSFHYVFKPNTERLEKMCTPQDLVGNWSIVFHGVPYGPINFEIINEWIPGSHAEIKPINPC